MIDTTKRYDVTYKCPILNKAVTQLNTKAPQVYTNANGELRFAYNHRYDACEVISINEVNADYIKAMANYFDTFGTAGE